MSPEGLAARISDPAPLDQVVPASERKPFDDSPLVVWQQVDWADETCSLGRMHRVTYWARKVLGPVVDVRVWDNGYEKLATSVRTDRQGRLYHQHVSIDFYSSPTWIRDGDHARFKTRPAAGDAQRDVLTGKLL